MEFKVAVIFGVLFIVTDHSQANHWKYEDEGHWSETCQKGTLQSPIALSKYISVDKEFLPFALTGYENESPARMKNNGHSAEVRLSSAVIPEVKGGSLPHTYQLDHLHFHWQSEHTIENRRFPLELHLVHYAKDFKNVSEALKHRHGVAVFAVLFDLSPDNDEDMDPLVKIVENLKDRVGEPRDLDKFVVKDFLPRDKAGFYRYEGSLTTPGCTEGILWTVFTNKLPISESQVKIFESIRTEDKSMLKKNYRSLQDLNDRTVYLKTSPINHASTTAPISISLIVAFVLFISFCRHF